MPNLAAVASCQARRRSYDAQVRPGTRVEVRSRFEAAWSRGFEVAERVEMSAGLRYKLRRRSDGSILPVLFDEDDLREERRRGTWWVQ
jgi:hypothetical protein